MNERASNVSGAAIAKLAVAKSDTKPIQARIIKIIADMVQDWGVDAESITSGTGLVADLEFVSVDIIHLVVAIEEDFERPKMGFEELLMNDGQYVDEVTIEQLANFVASKF
ncbi:MAG: acyl carrier protein [Pseudomonadota bacterium]